MSLPPKSLYSRRRRQWTSYFQVLLSAMEKNNTEWWCNKERDGGGAFGIWTLDNWVMEDLQQEEIFKLRIGWWEVANRLKMCNPGRNNSACPRLTRRPVCLKSEGREEVIRGWVVEDLVTILSFMLQNMLTLKQRRGQEHQPLTRSKSTYNF